MKTRDFITELNFCYEPEQRERFVDGKLGPIWMNRYPKLFDADDKRIYRSQCEHGYHFFEWLSAVLLYESSGYLTMMEKYASPAHKLKYARFQKIVTPEVFRHVMDDRTGTPDLFVHSADQSDWYFCEVKGPTDKLRDHQLKRFKKLFKASGRKIRILWLQH